MVEYFSMMPVCMGEYPVNSSANASQFAYRRLFYWHSVVSCLYKSLCNIIIVYQKMSNLNEITSNNFSYKDFKNEKKKRERLQLLNGLC